VAAPAPHSQDPDPLARLLSPRHIAVFGGRAAAEVIRQCRQLGFQGPMWPVHPTRRDIEGLPCYPSAEALPEAPDASFIAVPAHETVKVVRALAQRGAGGVICYASGFAETGEAGARLQAELVQAAGPMALIGPNCYGLLNGLDGVALWPDQHGGQRVARGVVIVTQSGNIGLNLTMQRRALPLAGLITVGNQAGTGMEEIVSALLQDERVSAIGLHIEGLDDVQAFSRVALEALRRGVPLVALKAGSSDLGARTTLSHTSSLAGADALYDALFERCGVARVQDLSELIETLKLLHVHGPLAGQAFCSASCSGGEASLVADLAQRQGLSMPELPPHAAQALAAVLGAQVTVANPLDYHTYIWGDLAAQTACFTALLESRMDLHLLVLDFPRDDRCDGASWHTTLDAFIQAQAATGVKAGVLSTLPEGMPEAVAQRLLAAGIVPLQGTADGLKAMAAAAQIGAAGRRTGQLGEIAPLSPLLSGARDVVWDEASSKALLRQHGLPVPAGAVCAAHEAVAQAEALGYPVVLKVVSAAMAHKTEVRGVRLNLHSAEHVASAVAAMAHLGERFLVEKMAQGVVAELIVGLHRDPQFGLALTLGAGGIWVELLQDSRSLLLPTSPEAVLQALHSLRIWPLLAGHRGQAPGDVAALVDAIMATANFGLAHADRLLELDINPLLVLPQGQGVLAVDALMRMLDNN
jgi:acyl-CoA synthetase (NDP forming)